jgi:hypothetical protein
MHVTSSGGELEVGVWEVAASNKGRIEAAVVESIADPRIGRKALIACESP